MLVVEMVCDGKNDDEAADNLDNLADQVERILGADDTLNCTVNDIILESVEFEQEEEAQKPLATSRLIYNVEFYEFVPEDRRDQKDIDDFTDVKADWDVGTANDPDPEATDEIELPQV